jgi:hypothetical protein
MSNKEPMNDSDQWFSILPVIEIALETVGVIILLVSIFVFPHDKETISSLKSPLKSLKEISLKEIKMNLNLNINSLSMMLIAFTFIIMSLCVQIISSIILLAKFEEAPWMKKLEMFIGSVAFLITVVFYYSLIHDHDAFERIVNNRVSKSYKIIIILIAIILIIKFLITLYKFMKNIQPSAVDYMEFVLAASYVKLILAGFNIPLTSMLYQELKLKATDG